jgi:hypothetical protein
MTHEETPSAPPASPILESDRRGAERHACDAQPFWLLCDLKSDAPPARIRDVSRTGIGLLVKETIKAGTVLVIKLQTRDQWLSRPLPVRVMHATLQEDGDWLIGCQFVRALSNQDLHELRGEE